MPEFWIGVDDWAFLGCIKKKFASENSWEDEKRWEEKWKSQENEGIVRRAEREIVEKKKEKVYMWKREGEIICAMKEGKYIWR